MESSQRLLKVGCTLQGQYEIPQSAVKIKNASMALQVVWDHAMQ